MTVIHAQNPLAALSGKGRSLLGVEAGLGAAWLALAVIAALVGGRGVRFRRDGGLWLPVLSGLGWSRRILR
jgi:hypothetical protein